MNQLFTAYIALGSNLNNPIQNIEAAIREIATLSDTTIIGQSQLYRTKPIGPDQPDIINAVIKITTGLEAYPLLRELQRIELAHGRERTIRFGARTLDLDILLFDDIQMNDETLTIPHPRMQDRNFVLIPLKDIAPNLVLQPFGHIDDLINQNDPEDYVIPLDFKTLGNKS